MRQDFFEDVIAVVKLIPHGRVTSYGAIARYLGANRSSRMVGYALHQCVTVEGVPAHRVVNRLGLLTGRHHFPTDNPMDKQLMAEGVQVAEMRVVEFDTLFWDPSKELL